MTIRFAQEPLTDALWDEAMPLLVEHWREISHFADIPLDPDRSLYDFAFAQGILYVYTARDEDSAALMGYALFFVRPAPHYAGSLQAAQDVIYVTPSARGSTGYRFIAFCDEQLRVAGVQVVRHHVKAAHNFGAMLERQGYEAEDVIYTKRLDAPAMAGKIVHIAEDIDGRSVLIVNHRRAGDVH